MILYVILEITCTTMYEYLYINNTYEYKFLLSTYREQGSYVHVLKSRVKTVKAAENRPELSNFIFNTPYSRWIDVKETALH